MPMPRLSNPENYKQLTFYLTTDEEAHQLLMNLPEILKKMGSDAAMVTSIATHSCIIIWIPSEVYPIFVEAYKSHLLPEELN